MNRGEYLEHGIDGGDPDDILIHDPSAPGGAYFIPEPTADEVARRVDLEYCDDCGNLWQTAEMFEDGDDLICEICRDDRSAS